MDYTVYDVADDWQVADVDKTDPPDLRVGSSEPGRL